MAIQIEEPKTAKRPARRRRRGGGYYLKGRTWKLDCWIHGRRYQETLARDVPESVAAELAQQRRVAIIRGEAGLVRTPPADPTWAEAVAAFRARVFPTLKPNTQRDYALCLAQLDRRFAGDRLSAITRGAVEQHRADRRAAGAPIRANRETTLLGTVITRARVWELYSGPNPVQGIRRLKEPQRRLRFLTVEEEARLLAAVPAYYRLLIMVCIDCGPRAVSEALALTWRDVDLEGGRLTLKAEAAKSSKERHVPLTPRLREGFAAAAQARARDGATPIHGHVFTTRTGQPLRSLRSVFRRACQRAGLEGVSPHVLRHTWASRMVMSGADLRTLQQLGGWATLELVKRYSHLADEHVQAAVQRMAAAFPVPPAIPTTPNVVALTRRKV
jgi:integrase